MTHRIAWLLGLCLVLALAPRALAQTGGREAAKQHFAAGEAKFKAGDYRGAISEFAAADALVPSPILAFNIALCHEKLGEDAMAITLYRDYLGRLPDAKNRATVEARIAELEARIAARKATPPPPDPNEQVAPDLDEMDPPPSPETQPAPTTPRRYDEALARRVPLRGQAGAPPVAGAGMAYPPGGAAPPEAGAPQPRPAPVPEQPKPSKPTPVYKQWWFWVVVGVSAIILIDIASGPDTQNGAAPAPAGATIFRF